MTDPEQATSDSARDGDPPNRARVPRHLDAFVSATVIALVATVAVVPWALVRGGVLPWTDPEWFTVWLREGQFLAATLLVLLGLLLLRPGLGSRGRDDAGSTAAPGREDDGITDVAPDAAETPRISRVLADALNRDPPASRVALGWRVIGGGVLLVALSLGIEAVV